MLIILVLHSRIGRFLSHRYNYAYVTTVFVVLVHGNAFTTLFSPIMRLPETRGQT